MKKFAESEIQKMMKKLDLTREEAIQLLQDDEDDVSVELTAEQKKVVKKMTQGDRKKEDIPRKRERKIDENKRYLMAFFENVLKNNENIEDFLFTNVEGEAVFKYKGETYRLTLAKPREKKSE